MASINLLGQNDQQKQAFTVKLGFGRALASFGAVLLLVSVGVYGWLAFQERRLISQIDERKMFIDDIQREIVSSSERRQIIVRQGQLRGFEKVSAEYSYWSRLLPELARTTIKTGGYASVSVSNDNQLRLNLMLSDFADFDKFLQVFDNVQYNQNLYNVRVVSAAKYQSDQVKGIKVELEMSINPELLKAENNDIL